MSENRENATSNGGWQGTIDWRLPANHPDNVPPQLVAEYGEPAMQQDGVHIHGYTQDRNQPLYPRAKPTQACEDEAPRAFTEFD